MIAVAIQRYGTAGPTDAVPLEDIHRRMREQLDQKRREDLERRQATLRAARLDGSSGLAVQFSSDGTRLFTASVEEARVWDARSFAPITEPLRHGAPIRAAAMSGDGSRVMTAGGKEVRVWEVATGRVLRVLAHEADVTDAALSPDRRLVASAAKKVTVWNATTGERVRVLDEWDVAVGTGFSPDGRTIYTCDAGGPPDTGVRPTIRLWDAATGSELSKETDRQGFEGNPREPRWERPWMDGRPGFSADGGLVDYCYNGGWPAILLGARDMRFFGYFGDCQPEAWDDFRIVSFGPVTNDRARVLVAGSCLGRGDPAAQIWDVPLVAKDDDNEATGKMVRGFAHDDQKVTAAALSADGSRVVLAGFPGHDKTLDRQWAGVWDVASGRQWIDALDGRGNPVVAFSPDGTRVALSFPHGLTREISHTSIWNIGPTALRELNHEPPDRRLPPAHPMREVNASPPTAPGGRVVAIVGATLIDGTEAAPVPDSVVLVRGDTIVAAGPRAKVAVPDGAELVDAAGLTLMPGLIDAHFHLDGRYDLPNLFLRHGITSVRDPGAWIEAYEPVRQAEAAGQATPRLFLTGPHFDGKPHAHPKDAIAVTTDAEARDAVNRFADQGGSAVKIYYRLPPELYRPTIAAAHARGLPVTSHLELVKAVEAIAMGVDGIEHASSFGTSLVEPAAAKKFEEAVRANNAARRDLRYELWASLDLYHTPRLFEVLDLAVEAKVVLCPTLGVFEAREGDAKASPAKVRGFVNMQRFTGMYQRAGGRIAVGSHSEAPHAERGWAYQREMELLVEAGIKPEAVIRAATLENARYFRAADRLGSIEPGKRADLMLVAGDPLRDMAAMRQVRRVMLNGNWVDLNPPATQPATRPSQELLRPSEKPATQPKSVGETPAPQSRAGGTPAPQSRGGFTDISKESGVEAAIDTHYERVPKWWITGTNLVDLDGDLDLFLGAHGQTAAVALNDGRGNFRYIDPATAKLPPTEIHIACDIDGDGRADLQMTHQDGGGRWYRNLSKPGEVRFEATQLIADQGRENAMIDVDRDGKLDWVHEDARKTEMVFEMGDGQGSFRRGGTMPSFRESSAIPADLNGDGQIDFVIKQCGYHDEKAGRSRVMLNDGKGRFADRTADCGLVEAGLAIQGLGDVNQDGSIDLICIVGGKETAIYLNDGAARFKKLEGAIEGMQAARKPAYANWGIAVATDFDNDGTPDILSNGRNFLHVLRGLGGGRFAYMNKAWGVPDFSWAAVDEGHCFGDIDHDGRLDLVVSTGTDKRKRMSLFRNDLPPRNWLNVRPIGAAGNRPAAGAMIRLLEPGTGKLLWHEQVIIAGRQTAHTSYAYGTTERHFGLGDRDAVDVRVEFCPSGKVVTKAGVKANQTVEMQE